MRTRAREAERGKKKGVGECEGVGVKVRTRAWQSDAHLRSSADHRDRPIAPLADPPVSINCGPTVLADVSDRGAPLT